MGNYINNDFMYNTLSEEELSELTNDASDSENVDDVMINDFILTSESLIDSYLSVKYATPLTNVPNMIKNMTAIITKFFLYERRDRISESLMAVYKQQIQWLKDLSLGIVELPIDQGGTTKRVSVGFVDRSKQVTKDILF